MWTSFLPLSTHPFNVSILSQRKSTHPKRKKFDTLDSFLDTPQVQTLVSTPIQKKYKKTLFLLCILICLSVCLFVFSFMVIMVTCLSTVFLFFRLSVCPLWLSCSLVCLLVYSSCVHLQFSIISFLVWSSGCKSTFRLRINICCLFIYPQGISLHLHLLGLLFEKRTIPEISLKKNFKIFAALRFLFLYTM